MPFTCSKHVRKDLDPYVCLFDECDMPLQLYSSSREWLSHMRSRHRMRWYCFATSHEPSFFGSADTLERHLRESHAGYFNSEEISFLVENSRHPSLSVIEHCPFCQQTAEDTEEHVAKHLIQFALRSLPWPVEYCNSQHSSQSSPSEHSESTRLSAETNRKEDSTLNVWKTDWDAWEKVVQDGKLELLLGQQHDEPPLIGEERDVVGLNDFIMPNYDIAEDKILEPFRKRANFDAAREKPAETQIPERQTFVRIFINEEASFIQELHVLANIYKGISKAVSRLDQMTMDRQFRDLDRLMVLHEELLTDLRSAVMPVSKDTQVPNSPDKTVLSLPTAPELIGTIILEKLRKIGPAHEAYSMTHEGVVSLWQTLREK